jgi:hypothetical protein
MTEQTSSEVAHIAGQLIRMTDNQIVQFAVRDPKAIKSVAASALTQAEPKRKKLFGLF